MNFNCYHYDIARGAYLKPEIFKEALRLCARSGFTHFLPYLENMIRLPALEKACVSCAYTPEQWREFDQTAAECGMELIPHFNVIGHARDACAAYPELAGKQGGLELDVRSAATKEWTRNCLEAFCSFSSGTHFLIGGDEWQPPNHLLTDPGFNIAKAWADQINLAVDILKSYDRIPIVWHDMMLHYPETLELLSKDAVIAFWFYDDDSDYPALDMFQSMGFKTIMASGLCNGYLSGRRVAAIKRAVESHKKYDAYGMMVTSWSDGRWEKQQVNIKLCGKLLNEESVPENVIQVISTFQMWDGIGQIHPAREKMMADALAIVHSGAFDEFPDYKLLLLNLAAGDIEAEVASYLRYHYPEGPQLLAIKGLCPHGDVSMADLNKSREFVVSVDEKSLGTVIKVTNGDESFVLYPEYGASLQNYKKGDRQILAHSLPGFIETNTFAPGGYRSYSGVGGLRPIWSFGSHHNPCILWQGPFEWELDESQSDEWRITLSRDLFHVAVTYTIIVRKGESGFEFIASAVNKIDHAYGMFSFNLPLVFTPEELPEVRFEWEEDGQLDFRDIRNSFTVIPAKRLLTVRKKGWAFTIESDPDKTAGYYTDMSPSYVTPDLRGYYKKLNSGDVYATKWRFFVQ